jgi:hypothetical protein
MDAGMKYPNIDIITKIIKEAFKKKEKLLEVRRGAEAQGKNNQEIIAKGQITTEQLFTAEDVKSVGSDESEEETDEEEVDKHSEILNLLHRKIDNMMKELAKKNLQPPPPPPAPPETRHTEKRQKTRATSPMKSPIILDFDSDISVPLEEVHLLNSQRNNQVELDFKDMLIPLSIAAHEVTEKYSKEKKPDPTPGVSEDTVKKKEENKLGDEKKSNSSDSSDSFDEIIKRKETRRAKSSLRRVNKVKGRFSEKDLLESVGAFRSNQNASRPKSKKKKKKKPK